MWLTPGLWATLGHTVTAADTASAVGSGDLPVLATPRLLALAEEATVRAVAHHLDEGGSSVGTRVQLNHVRASPVGSTVRVTAELREVDGRRLRFTVVAEDGEGRLLADGEIHRVVVERDRFLARFGR